MFEVAQKQAIKDYSKYVSNKLFWVTWQILWQALKCWENLWHHERSA